MKLATINNAEITKQPLEGGEGMMEMRAFRLFWQISSFLCAMHYQSYPKYLEDRD